MEIILYIWFDVIIEKKNLLKNKIISTVIISTPYNCIIKGLVYWCQNIYHFSLSNILVWKYCDKGLYI